MSENSISTIALVLCTIPGILHIVEVAFPIWARWIINYVLPLFAPGLPKAKNYMDEKKQLGILDAGIASVPEDQKTAAKDYIFYLLFVQRQNSLALLAIIAAIIYAFQLPLEERALLHFLLIPMSALFALVNANHAGIPFLGNHPRVSRNGRNVGIAFTPFWIASTILNYLAFTYATN